MKLYNIPIEQLTSWMYNSTQQSLSPTIWIIDGHLWSKFLNPSTVLSSSHFPFPALHFSLLKCSPTLNQPRHQLEFPSPTMLTPTLMLDAQIEKGKKKKILKTAVPSILCCNHLKTKQ